MKEITQKIQKRLFELQDKRYKEFHGTLCNTCEYEIIGVRVPELRKLAKGIIKEDFRAFLDDKEINYYEEIMLKGLIIGLANLSFDETCKYLKDFIPIIDNWAVCDITCSSLKITKKYMDEMWEFLFPYVKSNNEYEIRFSIVMYLSYYINQKYLQEIFKIIENIKDDGYYTKMAIAWFISIAYIKEKDMTIKFLNNTNIDNWTYNKALQKIVESYRVSDEDKVVIRKLKRLN